MTTTKQNAESFEQTLSPESQARIEALKYASKFVDSGAELYEFLRKAEDIKEYILNGEIKGDPFAAPTKYTNNPALSISIDSPELGWPNKNVNALKEYFRKEGCYYPTVKDVLKISRKELWHIRGMGAKGIKEIDDTLMKYDIRLK